MGTGVSHTGVGCILHIHSRCEVMLHVDGPVIQGDLRIQKQREIKTWETKLALYQPELHIMTEVNQREKISKLIWRSFR